MIHRHHEHYNVQKHISQKFNENDHSSIRAEQKSRKSESQSVVKKIFNTADERKHAATVLDLTPPPWDHIFCR